MAYDAWNVIKAGSEAVFLLFHGLVDSMKL